MKHVLTLLLVLCAMAVHAKPTISVSCPDTVRVDTPFWYEVTVKARSYKSARHIVFPVGVELLTHKYEQDQEEVDHEKLNTLVMRFSLRITSMGIYHLPQISIEAEKQLMVSAPQTVVVLPEQQFEGEYQTAVKLLTQNGIEADSLHLKHKAFGNSVVLFSDDDTGCFAAVATSRYSRLMGDDGVLAWSTEGAMRSLDAGGPEWIFKSYNQQLDALAAGKAQPYKSNTNKPKVMPLLGGIAWGQGAPYNSMCSNLTASGKSVLAGCGPVALGQVMMYHKHPSQGRGKRAYKTGSQYYGLDLGGQHFEWNKLQEQYDEAETDTNRIAPIARLIASTGVATGAQFGRERTPTNASMYRSALVNNFGYATTTHSVKDGTAQDRIQVAASELQASRPMIVASKDHAFVLDGVQGCFMHYNMGWRGLANGWYRTLVTTDGQLAFETMVVGITPSTNDTKRSKTVNVKQAGTLATLLTDEDVASTTHLTITGELGNADIRLLRRMAGAVESTDWNAVRGCLTHLDLSAARFITDRDSCFLRFPATSYKAKRTITTTHIDSTTNATRTTETREDFDFDNMTQEKWELFKKYNMHQQPGYYLTQADGGYYICCHTDSAMVSYCMWKDCENLSEIILPENTEKIGDRAFADCTSLLRLDIPGNCKLLGREVFNRCIAIEEVTYTHLQATPKSNFQSALRDANPLTPDLTQRRE